MSKHTKPGIHGGRLLIVRKNRPDTSWYSNYRPNSNDPPGDPGLIASLVGNKAAYFLGFRRISNQTVTIPNAAELNGGIEALNKQILAFGGEPITIRYYSPNGAVSVKEYLERFARNLELPLVSEGDSHLILHDASFHTSAIVLPKEVLEHRATQIRRILDFMEFLKNEKGIHDESILTDSGLDTDLDNLTANLAALQSGRLRRDRPFNDFLDRIHAFLVGYVSGLEQSADAFLMDTVIHSDLKQGEALAKEFILKHPDSASFVPGIRLRKTEDDAEGAGQLLWDLINKRRATIGRGLAPYLQR